MKKILIIILSVFTINAYCQMGPLIQSSSSGTKNANYIIPPTNQDLSPDTMLTKSGRNIKYAPIVSITDIPVFPLLLGRSGGQTLIGGTAANNRLTLQANSASTGNVGLATQFKVGNSGVINALNLYHSGKLTIRRDGLTTTQDTTGLWFRNLTAATSGATIQRSPSLIFQAAGWDTDNTSSTSHYMAWQLRSTSSTAPLPQLYLTQSLDGSTWNDVLYIQKSQSASMTLYGATGADALNFATLLTNLITGRAAAQDIDISLNSTTADRKLIFGANYGADDISAFQYKSSGVMWHGFGTNAPTTVMDVNANEVRIRTAQTPSGPTAAGTAGTMCWDADYIYVCVATNTWKRVAISSGGW